MTFEEMQGTVNAILLEGEAAGVKAEQVLHKVPNDDLIVGELYQRFSNAADVFEVLKRKPKCEHYNELIAAAIRLRDATLAWARYVEAVAADPSKSTPGRFDAIFARLHARGLIADSGQRRWSPKKQIHDVVWVIAPGVPEDFDAGCDVDNWVLEFLRG